MSVFRAPGDLKAYHFPDAKPEADAYLKGELSRGRRQANHTLVEPITFPPEKTMSALFTEDGQLRHRSILENDSITTDALLDYARGRLVGDKKITGAVLVLDTNGNTGTAHTTTYPVTVRSGNFNHAAALTMDKHTVCDALSFIDSRLCEEQDLEELNWCLEIFQLQDPATPGVAMLPRDRDRKFCPDLVWGCLKPKIRSFFGSEKRLGLPVKVQPPFKKPTSDRLFVAAISSCFLGNNPCSTEEDKHDWERLQLLKRDNPWMYLIKELMVWSTTFLLPKRTALTDLSGTCCTLFIWTCLSQHFL